MTTDIARRTLLIGAAAGMAATAARDMGPGPPRAAAYALYDSNLPESRAFAAEARAAGAALFDIAAQEAQFWRGVRAGFPRAQGAALIGLTGWADWTILRGALEAQGLRVRRDQRIAYAPHAPARSAYALLTAGGKPARAAIAASSPRKTTLFAWAMA